MRARQDQNCFVFLIIAPANGAGCGDSWNKENKTMSVKSLQIYRLFVKLKVTLMKKSKTDLAKCFRASPQSTLEVPFRK